jgi:IS30 family transposase
MRHPRIMQKQWSLDEVRRLRELARQQLPLIVIARKLGKSPSAVASKAVRERISLAQKSNTLKTML